MNELALKTDLEKLELSIIGQVRELLKEAGLARPEVMSQQEVMDLLQVSENTLRRIREKGQLPYCKVGHKVFYLYSDLVELLRNHRIVEDL